MFFFSFFYDDLRIFNFVLLSVGFGNRVVFLKCLFLWEMNILDFKFFIFDFKRMLRKCC